MYIKERYKEWCTDVNRWETKTTYLGLINIYKLSLFNNKNRYRLFSYKSNRINKPILSYLSINTKEIKEQYNGNKWIVPITYKITEDVQ